MKIGRKRRRPGDSVLARFSLWATKWAGSSGAFAAACGVILLWIATGPIFHYSDTWQLVINTGTTIVTFLMVFLIQRAQNKESRAIHLKLNELVAALAGASNRLVNVDSSWIAAKSLGESKCGRQSQSSIDLRLYGRPALNQPDEQDHHGGDEQDVDEAGQRVSGDQTEQPEDEENHEDRPEHGTHSFLVCARTVERPAQSRESENRASESGLAARLG